MMLHNKIKTLVFAGGFLVLAGMAQAESVDTFGEMITEGKAYLNFRYRWENVDQDGFSSDANALTLRSRLGYETAAWNDFQALFEVEDVRATGSDNYNSTTNGKTQYPVVADPQGTEINQAYVTYAGLSDTVLKGGRFQLVLDNARFVGDVGWRQNNQVYDGAALINSSFENLTLLYGYVGNVNRINGDDHPRGDISTQAHLFNGKYVFGSELSATLFSYLLDLTDDVPSLSTVTYGGRLNGASEMDEDLSLLYDASYAYQEDYADNLTSFGASYLAFEGGVSFGDFTAKIGWESLGSDNGTAAFTTPIATLHKFNGWADQFLSTPANGLEDLYGSLSYKISGTDSLLDDTTILAVYHSFQADEGGMDYGTEWDISVTKSLGENYSIGAWYAGYNSDGFAADTDKIMLSFSASFTQS